MTALRVGFDTGPLYGPKSGIGFAVQHLHDALAAQPGIELLDYLVSFRARPAPPAVRLPMPAAVAVRCWAHGRRPRVDRWLKGAALVHGTNYVVPPSHLPRLVSVYDCWFLRHPEAARPAVRRAGAVLRRAVADGAVVHTSSHATEAAVRELLPGAAVRTVHLAALPLPAPPTMAPIAELAGRPFVVAIGTLEKRKNLPVLVRAFGLLAEQHPEVSLVLAGADGDDRVAIHEAVDALGPRVSNRVMFAGRIDESARSWLLHHAAVLAYPSLDEGFGFPLLDAMQASVPVVASTAGSIPEVAGDAALLCAPDDVQGLAANLGLALDSLSVRAHLVATGTQRWRQFSWARCAAEMAELYHLVAAGDVAALR
ncbi:MAG: glycosyltransferase family 1 protein [Actinomycetota bacterium]|nr:glycosyltransferase family 1 protein [Actinomycetota bacterium]